ncbi:SH3 domain-containing protein [Labrenzia sp. OB1]|uniref:SH3 domain-containing protein n=1 Tax=Labrenzia sp. OB1 TaxID=1561204 RepID=UPI0007B2CF3A|nr:SH3 domain-containing protein [Labrenzia sp. OB1]KZM50272.1 hypothetical protein OA90_10195 [Labrenzia sp. OB1]
MYSFSAPAIACDPFADGTQDNANLPATKSDLRLVEIRKPAQDSPKADESASPPDIAGKILQMHANAEVPEAEPVSELTDRPKPVVSTEEVSHEILKGIRKKLEDGVPLEPNRKTVLWDQSSQASAEPLRRGPGFKVLIASALVVIACGGGALTLSMTGLPGNSETSTLETAPQLAAAETTLERLIGTEDPEPGVSTPEPALVDGAGAADADGLQIARAKDKLREALAAHGLSDAPPLNQPTATVAGAAGSQDSKIQARLVVRQISAPAAPSQSAVNDLPGLTPPVNDGSASPAQTANGETGPTAIAAETQSANEVSKAEGNTGTAAAQDTQSADPSFPNAGKIAAAVNLRQSADKNAEILAVVPAGSNVRFGDCGTWWCSIVYEGQAGFVGQKFLEKSAQVD